MGTAYRVVLSHTNSFGHQTRIQTYSTRQHTISGMPFGNKHICHTTSSNFHRLHLCLSTQAILQLLHSISMLPKPRGCQKLHHHLHAFTFISIDHAGCVLLVFSCPLPNRLDLGLLWREKHMLLRCLQEIALPTLVLKFAARSEAIFEDRFGQRKG